MQVIPLEQIENHLKEMVDHKRPVMVRFFVNGTAELCICGLMSMEFQDEDDSPFFFVNPPNTLQILIRFYGSDVQRITNGPTSVPQIYLGGPIKDLTNEKE